MKGKLTISHVQCNTKDDDYVSIRVEDELSRIEFVEIQMSHEEFGKALGSFACRPCAFDARGLDKIGRKMESKTLSLPKPLGCKDRKEAVAASKKEAEQYEVDGWMADVEGAYRIKQPSDCLKMMFRRWVNVSNDNSTNSR